MLEHGLAKLVDKTGRRDLAARVRALPGVDSVTIADLPPLSGTMVSTMVTTVDRDSPIESRAYMSSVAGDYFKTLGIALVRGRGIDEIDRRGSPDVAVVNETLARRLWPDGDALGKRLNIGFSGETWREVVGVAGAPKPTTTACRRPQSGRLQGKSPPPTSRITGPAPRWRAISARP